MSDSVHYCFVTYGIWRGNAGLIRPKHLGVELIELGQHVTYIVDDFPYNRTSLDLHPRANVEYVSPPRGPGQIEARRKILRQLNPDFVHLLNPHAKSLAAVAAMDLAVVADWDEPNILKPAGFIRRSMENGLANWLQARAVLNISCTTWLKDYLQSRFGLHSVCIPHAAYLPQYPEGASPYREPTLVYLGNYFPSWDHEVTFEAARILKQQGFTPAFFMIGDGPERARWQQFVAQHGLTNVTIAGAMSGEPMWNRLRHAHALLFPIRAHVGNMSRCPSKTFAYMQARRPIITSAVGEVPLILGPGATYIEATPELFAEEVRSSLGRNLPDVDYHVENQTWCNRAQRLLDAVRSIQ